MLDIERRAQIMEILKENNSMSVVRLSKQLYTSEATIRRDLTKLENEGLVKRTYGGVVLIEGLKTEIPLSMREREQQESKNLIGKVAASLVRDGSIIILDSSSTTSNMVRHLAGKNNLSILTNGAKTAVMLGEGCHANIYCTGGKLRRNSLSFIGEEARAFIARYHVDTMFFSCRGLVFEDGLFDSSTEEAELRRAMIKSAKKRVLLCDSTKIGKHSFQRICNIQEINTIITNAQINTETIQALQEKKSRDNSHIKDKTLGLCPKPRKL